jgi:hypothetical protein
MCHLNKKHLHKTLEGTNYKLDIFVINVFLTYGPIHNFNCTGMSLLFSLCMNGSYIGNNQSIYSIS